MYIELDLNGSALTILAYIVMVMIITKGVVALCTKQDKGKKGKK